jgi:hypothetical protein
MNRRNVERLINHLKSIDPKHFDMGSFSPSCGTACCVAGHAVELATGKPSQWTANVPATAAQWLEIDEDILTKLFHLKWPEEITEKHKLDNVAGLSTENIDYYIRDGYTDAWEPGNPDTLAAAIDVLELMLEGKWPN